MIKDVFTEVVDPGFCIGCGACAAVRPDALRMDWDRNGFYRPLRRNSFRGPLDPITLAVCPFADDAIDEDAIAEGIYGKGSDRPKDRYIGFYQSCFIGYCNDPAVRQNATSGGIIGWLIRHVLTAKMVDKVVAVGDGTSAGELYSFKIYRSVSELDRPMKSRYYPTEISRVVQEILEDRETLMFVGLPCQLKALRKIALQVPRLQERLKITVSLFCGHQKSRHYADYLAMHAQVRPEAVVAVDYRKKLDRPPASSYGFEVEHRSGGSTRRAAGMTSDVFGSSWSNNLFMNPACEFCDDVVGETADISVGDAWLPGYVKDPRGTSIIVVRTKALDEVFRNAGTAGVISLTETDAETVYQSQAGGFRQRREGLQYRLVLAKRRGRLPPRKRVTPSVTAISFLDRVQQRLRIQIRKRSNEGFRRSDPGRSLLRFRWSLGWLILLSRVVARLRNLERRVGLRLEQNRQS